MDSDESTTSRDYDSPRRSHRSSPRDGIDNDVEYMEKAKSFQRKRLLLEKLPSPREFQTPPQEELPLVDQQPKSISISELNPFFDELDATVTSTTSSLCDDDDGDMQPQLSHKPLEASHNRDNSSYSRQNRANSLCRRTSSFRRIWSSLGSSSLPGLPVAVPSKSQDSSYSSSGLSDSRGDGKRSFRTRLKRISHKVGKHLTATSEFIVDKLARHSTNSDSSLETNPQEEGDEDEDEEGDSPDNHETKMSQKKEDEISKDHYGKTRCVRVEPNDAVNKGNTPNESMKLDVEPILSTYDIEHDKLIWTIPNWVDNSETNYENTTFSLQDQIENEKRKMAEKQPAEWAEAVEYLQKSMGRDFRRGYLALGEKMHLPNLQAVRCLKFSQFRNNHSFLAIGCEEGTLIILELDYQKPLAQLLDSEESLQNLLYHVPVRSECRIQMNETLVGHVYDLKCIVWNNANGKLLTSDEVGVIIGWGYSENECWVEEIINDRSTSRICDMAWSPDGKRVAIGYEDFSEHGKITAGVIVGLADGTQIFDRKFHGLQISFVVWYSDSVLWTVVGFTLYSLDEKGEMGKAFRSIEMVGGSSDLVEFMVKPKSSWITSTNAPEFITVYKDSCMALYSSFSDKTPLRVHTQIIATCADWSANGVYIIVGGFPVSSGRDYVLAPQVHLYNYEGKLLQILKIPEQSITSISWAHDSLHLTLASERHIYFANLRPMYKLSSSKNVHCYAYSKGYTSQWITFWNEKTSFREMIPGKVIDIKSYNDKFSVLCMDNAGVYHVFVFSDSGVKQQHLCVITMEPFALAMTKSSVICLAPNAVLNWNYTLSSGDNSKKFTGALKTTRQVHVDEFPGIIVKPGEKQDHLLKPVIDCARCMHAMRDRLCVARESGKLQLYALPTLVFLQTYRLDLGGDICQEIKFNNDGNRLALLTMNGHLRICQFPEARERRKDASYTGQTFQLVLCENLASVTGFIWATDMSQHLCVLEGSNIHFLQDDQIIETISNIPSGCYLTNYEGLYANLLYMDKVIDNPENPSAKMLLRLAAPSLSRIIEALENGENMDEIMNILNSLSFNHQVLRKIVADEALRQGDVKFAEHIFMEEKNYQGLRFLENINDNDLELQRAQIHCYLMEYQEAQHYFIRAGKKDLAIKMWKDLGDWEKVSFLSGYNSEDTSVEALEYQYAKFWEAQDFEMALDTSLKLDNPKLIVQSCVMMEDYGKLVALMDRLPPKDPLLAKIGRILAGVGLIDEASYCFSAYGEPATAMSIAVETRHWDLAMKLSKIHKLPLIQPALVKHVKGLITSNQLNPAIQVLDRCGKFLTAGKLLIYKGLRMLQEDSCNIMEVKKIFVLAAKMLLKKKCRGKMGTVGSGSKSINETVEELDLEFLIPKDHVEVMAGHNEWCWSDPWRGAEAVHFLNLCQRFIYRGMMGRAFKAAMYLRKFEDIIGFERINSLIALTAINNGYFSVASNALLKLETENDGYSEISFSLFKDRSPKNHNVSLVECPGCNESIPDFYSFCPLCNMQFTICIFSACPIPKEMEMWTCQTCFRNVEHSKRDRFDYCLLCHSKI